MRVMVLIRATPQTEAGEMPSEAVLTAMGKFNEELVNAGMMLAGEGLHPSSKGVRIQFSGKDGRRRRDNALRKPGLARMGLRWSDRPPWRPPTYILQ